MLCLRENFHCDKNRAHRVWLTSVEREMRDFLFQFLRCDAIVQCPREMEA